MTSRQLKKWRREAGMTQPELAEALKLPNPYTSGKTMISRWENGARPIPSLLGLALVAIDKPGG